MIKRLFSIVMLAGTVLASNAQYQLANGGFEEWESVTYSGKTGDEPVKWSSFLDGTGNLKSMAGVSQLVKSKDEIRPGSEGIYSAKLTSRSVLTVVAQGNLTTGCVNMGSTSATNANGNYNYINHAREDQSMKFTGHPDAVKVWTKFKGVKTANVEVVLVTDGYYQSPEANDITATKVAHAQNSTIPSTDTWTEYTIPFTYSNTDKNPEYVLVNLSTCAEPGKGDKADYMYVDDMVMVYNSELESATYNGAEVTFNGNSATVNAEYDESLLELVSNGHAATIEKDYNETTGVLTITVKGENISEDASNEHTYTIKFNIKVTMNVSSAKWATFIAPFDVTARTVSAYTVEGVEENGHTLTLKRVFGTTINKHTPVIIYSDNVVNRELKGMYEASENLTRGLLTGTYEEISAPAGSYVLKNQDGVVGFYRSISTTKVPANRCYLNAEAGEVKAFFFAENETDGITEINADAKDNAIYDLHGRRVAKAQNGLYIINGKKVLVK